MKNSHYNVLSNANVSAVATALKAWNDAGETRKAALCSAVLATGAEGAEREHLLILAVCEMYTRDGTTVKPRAKDRGEGIVIDRRTVAERNARRFFYRVLNELRDDGRDLTKAEEKELAKKQATNEAKKKQAWAETVVKNSKAHDLRALRKLADLLAAEIARRSR